MVEKQLIPADDHTNTDTDSGSTPLPPQYSFIPLLERYAELFPNYKLHVAQIEKKKNRSKSKSPSPAGVRGTKAKGKGAGTQRAPSRKR